MTHTEFIEYASVFIFTHSYAEFVNNKKLLTVLQSLFPSNNSVNWVYQQFDLYSGLWHEKWWILTADDHPYLISVLNGSEK